MRKTEITSSTPTPQAGFGLYVYVLPESEVGNDMLRALEAFHQCLSAPGNAEAREALALLVLPVRSGEHTIDTSLAHALVRNVLGDSEIDKKEVYLIAVNQPLSAGVSALANGTESVVIRLGRVAPQYVGVWLNRMQSEIEAGRIDSPEEFDLKIQSVLVIVAEAGKLFGIVSPAQAEAYQCR